jgi:hypothetical protein
MKDTVYQEKKINHLITELQNCLSLIHRGNNSLESCEMEEEYYIQRSIENQYRRFNTFIKNLYIILIQYLESQGCNELIQILKSDTSEILNQSYESIKSDYDDEWENTVFWSDDFNKMKKIILPFEAFDSKTKKDIGLIYLENILLNTSAIIKDLEIVPNSETKIYNGVKHVIKSTFPDYINLTEPFYKEAKCYKPDILIPTLSTAIEYKFAQDEQRLIKTIEDILIDVVGYNNHATYRNFYAVFYVKPGIWSERRFQEVWNGYKFPLNWKSIYVIGE